ncbi:MAG: fasciclin domain-containing protein [Aeromicrobium sp.]
MTTTRRARVAAAVASVALLVTACGASSSGDGPADGASTSSAANGSVADLVGSGCADYAKDVPDGAGSFDGMAASPVATAARDNPLLGTFAEAISGRLNPDVDLVDLLDGGEYTVFAPIDEAFDRLPADTMTALAHEAGGATLTSGLTYHVIPRRLAPAELAGTLMTVNGAELTITGSGDDIMVGRQAAVVCGGIQTANATVYLIDAVLTPPAP